MAFHPYPRVIPPVFNRGGFGPPRGLTPASACPRIAHPASRRRHATARPFRARFRCGSFPNLTSPHAATRWLILQKARRHGVSQPLRLLVGARFQALFHSPLGVLFTFPSRYWFAIGHRRVFSLGGWSPPLRAGFHVPGPTRDARPGGGGAAYGALARSGRPFHAVPLPAPFVTPRGACGPPARAPATPAGQRPQACAPPPVWAGALSLAATRAISVDFSSSGYLDVSVPRVASPGPMDSGPGRAGTTPPGFPHSETCGSRAVCASPQLIAAYRVLLRLPVPRHPPCARSIFAPPLNTVSLESRLQVFVSHTALLARSRMRAARAQGRAARDQI